jgi:hypothetical protein
MRFRFVFLGQTATLLDAMFPTDFTLAVIGYTRLATVSHRTFAGDLGNRSYKRRLGGK